MLTTRTTGRIITAHAITNPPDIHHTTQRNKHTINAQQGRPFDPDGATEQQQHRAPAGQDRIVTQHWEEADWTATRTYTADGTDETYEYNADTYWDTEDTRTKDTQEPQRALTQPLTGQRRHTRAADARPTAQVLGNTVPQNMCVKQSQHAPRTASPIKLTPPQSIRQGHHAYHAGSKDGTRDRAPDTLR